MEFRIQHAPVFSTLEFTLASDEYVVAQPNSMLSMSGGIRISAHAGRQDNQDTDGSGGSKAPAKKSRRRHSIFGGIKSMLGGESFFTAEFRAKSDDQQVTLAPESYGDIVTLDLDEDGGYYLTRGSYLANVGATSINVTYGGVKGLMSRKGLFLMHATGSGKVFCQTYGAIEHHNLADGEVLFVDNRYVVAFADTVTYKLVKATESISDSLMSGEGFVNRYCGPGNVYYQTRGKPTGGLLSTILQAAF